jgi:uncharacterized protein (DUF342 family)
MNAAPEPGAHGPNPELEGMFEIVFAEISKVEGIQAQADAPVPSPARVPAAPAFRHVREPSPQSNPVFAKGLEYAELAPGFGLNDLLPGVLDAVPVVERGAILAVRDHRRKQDIHVGENVISRSGRGQEVYLAKERGRVVVSGGLLHVVPADRPGRIILQVAVDGMSAALDIHPAWGSGAPADFPQAQALLADARVIYGIRTGTIHQALAVCMETRRPVLRVEAARGSPAQKGKAGQIEYFFDREFQGPVNLAVDSEGKIDFRKVQWIPLVSKGQLLARVTPSQPAIDAIDVFGKPIPARQPAEVYLVPGKNVGCNPDKTEFHSELDGFVQLNGTFLDVMNVYVVNSDVDYRTGNIRFNGNVLITGTVTKGFEVEADGDVVVLGTVEPSRIKAGRDLIVKGGILGSGKGGLLAEAGRHIQAGYAENAWLEAQGDLRIENFSVQSFLYSCGRISLEKLKGMLIGGEAMGTEGVEAKSIGSEVGVKTLVAAGVNFTVKRKIQQLAAMKADIRKAMEKIDAFLKGLGETAARGALPASKIQAVKAIAAKRQVMTKTLEALSRRSSELEASLNPSANVGIRATEVVYPEVCLSIRGATAKVEQAYYRSLFILDAKGETIVRRPA